MACTSASWSGIRKRPNIAGSSALVPSREGSRTDSAGGQKSSVAPPPVTITGVPQAMASSTGMLKPSAR